MEPRIQYGRTADGVNIAFSVIGRGPALIHMMAPGGHIQQQWEVPEFVAYYHRVAQRRTLVQYDTRGTGLSQAAVSDFSLDALMMDLQAVVDRLGLDHFALWGTTVMGQVAIAYAARHPNRVSHLLLWHSYARASDWTNSPPVRALRGLMDNWDLYTDTLAHYFFGWPGGEPARRYAARMRDGVSQEVYRAILAETNRFDVTDLLPRVAAPTLVLHRRRFPLASVDMARELTAKIPNARLVILEGESGGFALEDSQAVIDAVEDFFGSREERQQSALPATAGREPRQGTGTDIVDGLTRREVEILRLIVAGKSSREIAAELFLSARTVERHIANIYRKTDTHGRAQLAAYALRNNLC